MHRQPTLSATRHILTLTALLVGTAATAETSTLTAIKGDTAITGEIKGFSDGAYLIATMAGEFRIQADEVNCEGPGCRARQIKTTWSPGAAGALASVTMPDGSIKLEGEVTAISGDKMTIDTAIGQFNLPLDATDCQGAGCPVKVETVVYVEADQLLADALANAETTELVNVVLGASDQGDGADDGAVRVAAATAASADRAQDQPVASPEITLAGPAEVFEVLFPVALNTYAEAFGGKLDLFDDRLAVTEDVGAAGLHDAGISYEVISSDGQRVMGLLGHPAQEPLEQIAMLAEGAADIALTVGEATPQEVALVANAGGGDLNRLDQQRIIAVDGLAAIVAPENPVDALGLDDMARVLSGDITNWSQLGGPNAPVNVHTFPTDHETFDRTRDLLLTPVGLKAGGDLREHALTREIVDAVMADPNAIGFVSYPRKRDAKALSVASACGLVTPATALTIKTEQYPLVQRIVAYNRAEDDAAPEVVDFLAYLESNELDKGVRQAGYVDLGVETEPLTGARQLVQTLAADYDIDVVIDGADRLIADMQGKERLSTVFRFSNASAVLDRRAERDLRRMIDFIASHPDARFTIVGFTDSVGTFSENEELAQRRADFVLDALHQADSEGRIGATAIATRGVGELYPLACEDTEADRGINRRVEVWMEG